MQTNQVQERKAQMKNMSVENKAAYEKGVAAGYNVALAGMMSFAASVSCKHDDVFGKLFDFLDSSNSRAFAEKLAAKRFDELELYNRVQKTMSDIKNNPGDKFAIEKALNTIQDAAEYLKKRGEAKNDGDGGTAGVTVEKIGEDVKLSDIANEKDELISPIPGKKIREMFGDEYEEAIGQLPSEIQEMIRIAKASGAKVRIGTVDDSSLGAPSPASMAAASINDIIAQMKGKPTDGIDA